MIKYSDKLILIIILVSIICIAITVDEHTNYDVMIGQDNLTLLYLNGDWIVVCTVTYSAAVTVCKQIGYLTASRDTLQVYQ